MNKHKKIQIGILILAIVLWIIGFILQGHGYGLQPGCVGTCIAIGIINNWIIAGNILVLLSLLLITIDVIYFLVYLLYLRRHQKPRE